MIRNQGNDRKGDISMDEEVFAKGKLFELVHRPQPSGRVFEIARRASGGEA